MTQQVCPYRSSDIKNVEWYGMILQLMHELIASSTLCVHKSMQTNKAASQPQLKPETPIAAHLCTCILPVLQEEEERLRREEERLTKRQQKTAESAQSAGLEEDQLEEVSTSHSQQKPAAPSADAPSCNQDGEGKDAAKAGDSHQAQQQRQQQQQQQQQQPQAKLQAAAVPAARLTKAQRQKYVSVPWFVAPAV